MLAICDCVGMCGLNEDELQVLARHEHLPMIVAAELAAELLKTPGGVQHLRSVIVAFGASHPAPPPS